MQGHLSHMEWGLPEKLAAKQHLSQVLPAIFPQWALMELTPSSRSLKLKKKPLAQLILSCTHLLPLLLKEGSTVLSAGQPEPGNSEAGRKKKAVPSVGSQFFVF